MYINRDIYLSWKKGVCITVCACHSKPSFFFPSWYINYHLEHIFWENALNTKTNCFHSVFFPLSFIFQTTCIYGDGQHSITQPISINSVVCESLRVSTCAGNAFKGHLAPLTSLIYSTFF